MVNSMTGFAALQGGVAGTNWTWDIRSVNARGLDIRLRLPEGQDALEQVVRKAISAKVNRGNVNLTLRIQRASATGALTLDEGQLSRVVSAVRSAEEEADRQGLVLTASSAVHLLSVRGVFEPGSPEQEDQAKLHKVLCSEVPVLIDAFVAARAAEGDQTHTILSEQLEELAKLVTDATQTAVERSGEVAESLKQNLAKVLQNADGADPQRLEQELALLAVKADVTEELDRLGAHIAAARELLASNGPVGRKFDFLMQEFNREANTLCSKSGSTKLTRIGLDLKTVIDQMREQVQNVE